MSLAPGLQWGTLDKDTHTICFPNLQSLMDAFIEITMTTSILGRLILVPVTGEYAYQRTVLSLSFRTIDREAAFCRVRVDTRDFFRVTPFISKIQQRPNGSVDFPNQLNSFDDTILYTDIVQRVYPSTYPAQKVDLSTFLMATQDQDSTVSRFFKHTLCERQVLNILKKF